MRAEAAVAQPVCTSRLCARVEPRGDRVRAGRGPFARARGWNANPEHDTLQRLLILFVLPLTIAVTLVFTAAAIADWGLSATTTFPRSRPQI